MPDGGWIFRKECFTLRRNRREARQFQNAYPWMYGDKRVKTVTFIVTHQCNLRCTYCYEHNKSDKKMTLETAKKCVDLLFAEDARNSELVNDTEAHGLIIEFIGGEPFLEIELIDQTMEYFLNRAIELDHRWRTQYMINISTNGTLGEDERIRRFIKKYDGRLSVSVTIDGAKEAHDACRVDLAGNGSYDRAIKMFRAVGGPQRRGSTKYTIAPGNIDKFAQAVRHLVMEEGVAALNCNCVYEEGWTLEHAQILYWQLKEVSDMLLESGKDSYVSILDWEAGNPMPETETQNWCGGDGRMLAFEVDGTVLPCMRYSSISISGQPSLRIGDVDSGIAVREDDRERLAQLRAITRQSQSEQTCLDCPIASGCGWCTAYNYEMSGTPNKRMTYICDMHKARVLAQCYHWNRKHLRDPEEYHHKKMYIPSDWAVPIIGAEEYRALKELEQQAIAVQPPAATAQQGQSF